MKKWTVAKIDKEAACGIAQQFDIPVLVAMLLQIRGFKEEEAVCRFLSEEAEFFDPFLMADMERAVDRIKHAVDSFEKICVYGDYDADGVTSTALLYSYLESAGANVMYYIPSRENEGYGMNIHAIETLQKQGVTLIITVDNGISAHKEIEYAKSLSIDTVVTDHHTPPASLPDAVAVVDPHRKDCTAPFKELAGVGVAFKLIMALEDENLDVEKLLHMYADLAALGTIGDIVPLTGENRLFVKYGLSRLENTDRVGVRAMLEEASLFGNALTAGKVSFTLVPRINACGRMGLSEKSVRLLLTEDKATAAETAAQLGEDNRQRQNTEKEILKQIEEELTVNPQLRLDRVIVVDGENWHQGVIGIVAARLKEIYGKPVIVISRSGAVAKGSGRSVKGFSLCDAVFACSSILTHYGGHPMAVGLSLQTKDIDSFRKAVNAFAQKVEKMPFCELEIDCKLNPASLSPDIVQQVSVLEPYGAGNPSPLFGLYTMRMEAIKPVGGGKHLKLLFSRNSTKIEAMRFACTEQEFPYQAGDEVDLAVTLDVNSYNGRLYLRVVVRDIKLTAADDMQMLCDKRLFESFLKEEPLTQAQCLRLRPIREEFAQVYRFLKNLSVWNYGADILCCRLHTPSINYGKLMVILTAMAELSLLSFEEHGTQCHIKMLAPSGKADLNTALIMQKFSKMQ